MAYTVGLSKGAERHFKALEPEIVRRVLAAFQILSDNPRPHGFIKLTGERDLHRIRVGRYRIIYQIDDHNRHIRVLKILHRREVYR